MANHEPYTSRRGLCTNQLVAGLFPAPSLPAIGYLWSYPFEYEYGLTQ